MKQLTLIKVAGVVVSLAAAGTAIAEKQIISPDGTNSVTTENHGTFIFGADNGGNQSEIALGGNIGLTANGTIYIGSEDGTTVNGGLTVDDLRLSNGLGGTYNVHDSILAASSQANDARCLLYTSPSPRDS